MGKGIKPGKPELFLNPYLLFPTFSSPEKYRNQVPVAVGTLQIDGNKHHLNCVVFA